MERSGRTPLVPPSLLRHRSMRSGLLLALPFFAGFGAFMFCYALLVQQGLHDSALAAGAGLAPMAAAFLARLAVHLPAAAPLRRQGPRGRRPPSRAAGLIILGVTVVAWPGRTSPWPGWRLAWWWPALGQGLVMSPLFGVVLSEVPPASAGAGSGVLTTTQQVALALGVATLGSLFITLAGDGVGMRDGFLVVLAIQISDRGRPGHRRPLAPRLAPTPPSQLAPGRGPRACPVPADHVPPLGAVQRHRWPSGAPTAAPEGQPRRCARHSPRDQCAERGTRALRG